MDSSRVRKLMRLSHEGVRLSSGEHRCSQRDLRLREILLVHQILNFHLPCHLFSFEHGVAIAVRTHSDSQTQEFNARKINASRVDMEGLVQMKSSVCRHSF